MESHPILTSLLVRVGIIDSTTVETSALIVGGGDKKFQKVSAQRDIDQGQWANSI